MIALLIIFLVSCTSNIPAEKQCSVDEDCAPATCCHPNDTVNKDFQPKCLNTICTMECAPGTTDCNQGEIKCIENECKVILN